MMNEIRTGLVLIALLILVRLEAQEIAETPKGEGAIFMLCHPNDETLQVRWAPDSWKIYQHAIKQGFTLTKTSIRATDTLVVTYDLKIPAKTIFSTHADAENDYAAAYHLLYEEVENTAGILGEYSAFEVGASRYGMLLFLADLNFSLAEYLQLGWTDEDYDPGYTNIYTIRINGSSFSNSILGGFACIPSPREIEDIFSFPDDHMISISWDLRRDRSGYVGFDIERSDDDDTWKQLNDQPIAVVEQGNTNNQELIIYKDSVSQNFRKYYYRIRGINSFGQSGPFSKTIEAEARPPINIGLPYFTGISNVGDTSINLQWSLEGKDIDQLQSIILSRAEHPDSTFQILDTLGADRREYLDRTALPINYYLITAYDQDKRAYTGPIAYGQLPDKVPPVAPKNVMANIDSLGNVEINWSLNREHDLSGYRVFYKRYLEDEIIQITTAPIRDTTYFHSLPLDLLHDCGYYMVRAEDQAGNRSPDSEFIKVMVPDTIRPADPTIISTRSEIYGCILNISLSGSKDVAQHLIQRKNLEGTIWEDQLIYIDPFIPLQQEVIDSTLEVGQEVQYRILVRDSTGNESVSNIAEGRRIDNKIRPKPEEVTVSWDRRKKQLIFSWMYPDRQDLQAVRIYKSSSKNIRFYTDLYILPADLEITDDKSKQKRFFYRVPMAEAEEGFLYKIRLEFNDGATSGISDFKNR